MKVIFAESHNLDRPDPVGSHQYIRLFRDAGHDCLWLGPAVSPFHLFKADKLNRYRFRVWREGLTGREGINWLVPFSLLFYYNQPLLRSLYAGRNQYRFCLPPLRKNLESAGFAPVDLLWCAGPSAFSLIDLVPHRLSCYRLADRLDKFSGIPRNVGKLQKELIEKVDFVLATSRDLWEWAATVRSNNLFYLPNGVDGQFFEQARNKPDDFPETKRPVAVYAGTLDTRFDLETVAGAVEALPGMHFLLIGPVTYRALEAGLESLKRHENFTALGAKPFAALPAYLQRCSAGMIPFHLNELTGAVNPIKYYEYLACGLPVIAPPMREMAETEGPVNIYRNREEFVRMLKKVAAAKDEERQQLKLYAGDNTWLVRFKEIEKIIDRLMK